VFNVLELYGAGATVNQSGRFNFDLAQILNNTKNNVLLFFSALILFFPFSFCSFFQVNV